MKILVVDDEDIIVQSVTKKIENIPGFSGTVLGANSAKEALEKMEYFKPNLLIMDIEMPGMNGLELLSIVKKKGLCEYCIILTAFESFEYARSAIHFHATDYLLKPIDREVLEDYIKTFSLKVDSKKKLDSVMENYSELFEALEEKEYPGTLERILKHINQNYAGGISLKEISEYSGMSENSICNIFKKEMKITFLEYLNTLRLKRSMELLIMDRDKTVKDISSMVGYNSERQFYRMFKGKIGMTPQQFRENNLFEDEKV